MDFDILVDYDEFCEGELFAGANIKPLTKRLVYDFTLDLPLEPPLIVDFGVESANHYRALRAALFSDSEDRVSDTNHIDGEDDQSSLEDLKHRIGELDAAYGNSAKLNEFVKRYAPDYAAVVSFQPTSWDIIDGRVPPDSDEKE